MSLNGAALLVPAGSVHRFQPEAGGPVYLLRRPAVHERAAWRREIASRNGRRVFPSELVDAVERGLEAVLPDPQDPERQRHMATIVDYRERLARAQQLAIAHHYDPTVDIAPLVELMAPTPAYAQLAALVARHWPEIAVLREDQQSWPEIAGIAAGALFLVGWEPGDPARLPPFEAGLAGGASEDSLAAIPVLHLRSIGAEVDAMMTPGWRALGNSPSGPGTKPGPTPSSSTAMPPASARPPKAGRSSRSGSGG